MRKSLYVLAILVLAAAPVASAQSAGSVQGLAKQFIDESVLHDPTFGDYIGVHTSSDKLPDLSATGFAQRDRWLEGWKARFATVAAAKLSPNDRADVRALQDQVALSLYEDSVLSPMNHEPDTYVSVIGAAAYDLTSQHYAPPEVRFTQILKRLSLIPGIVADAEANLTDVTPVAQTVAVKRTDGLIGFYQIDLPAAAKDAPADLQVQIAAALPPVIASLQDLRAFLEGPLASRATRNPRVGSAVYDRELSLANGVDESSAALLARAKGDFAQTRARMLALALPLDRQYFPSAARSGSGDALIDKVVGRVLGRIYDEHPSRDHFFDAAKSDIAKLATFVQKSGIVPWPEPDTLKIVATPAFAAGQAGASLSPAGPFDPLGNSYYYIDKIPADWSAVRATSYLRENNNYGLQLLSCHEGIPGHYVQFRLNNTVPSVVRRVFANGSFAEGWAIYGEGMLLDAGYGGGDPKLRLIQLKWRLREQSNVMIDIGFHTGSLTKEQIVKLLTREAFQENSEALTKLQRLNLSHVQLSSYYAGLIEIKKAEAAQRRALGSAFTVNDFNRKLLKMGSVEPRFIQSLL